MSYWFRTQVASLYNYSLRGAGRTKPLVLHDPPSGYRPPRRSSWYLLVNERHAGLIVRVAAVVLVLAAAAVAVIIVLMIAGYH